jgi:hypothetical protein
MALLGDGYAVAPVGIERAQRLRMKRMLLVACLTLSAGCHHCVSIWDQMAACPPCEHPSPDNDPSGPDDNGCYQFFCDCQDAWFADMAVNIPIDMSRSHD